MSQSRPCRSKPAATSAWGFLPPQMRVLHVTGAGQSSRWLEEAFAADSATRVAVEQSVGIAACVARLRDELFDAVLVSHDPASLDALELVEVLRTGGCEEAVIILGNDDDDELAAMAFEVGADAYVCVRKTKTRTLLWLVGRAIERHQLIGENRRLRNADQQRLRLEQNEAEQLLDQQRALIDDLESLPCTAFDTSQGHLPVEEPVGERPRSARPRSGELPAEVIDHYRTILRAYVIMGSGNLGSDMSALARLLVRAEISAPQTLDLHVRVLEEMIQGLGSRSARHVMNRADLLVVEVMVHLAECYRSCAASPSTA